MEYKKGETYRAIKDIHYGDYDEIYDFSEEFKAKYVENGKIIFKEGTLFKFLGSDKSGYVFYLDNLESDDIEFIEPFDYIK